MIARFRSVSHPADSGQGRVLWVPSLRPPVAGAASPGLRGQELLEGLEDVRWLPGGQVLQPGAQVLLEAPAQPTRHRADAPPAPRQRPAPDHVGQEVPEDRKDVALHGLGLPGVHRGHQLCERERKVTPSGPVPPRAAAAPQARRMPGAQYRASDSHGPRNVF